jgi:hypothetical protein
MQKIKLFYTTGNAPSLLLKWLITFFLVFALLVPGKKEISNFSLEFKKAVFFSVVAEEDKQADWMEKNIHNLDAMPSEIQEPRQNVAAQFGITKAELNAILMEGSKENWLAEVDPRYSVFSK